MRFLLRVLVSAAALGVATWVVSGITLPAASGWSKAGTLLVVALTFGIITATLKPLIKVVGCAFYVLTLGLVALVVNGLLLWLTSWVAGKLSLPFHITGFWAAFWGAIIVGIVGWLLGVLRPDRDSEQPECPSPSRPGSSCWTSGSAAAAGTAGWRCCTPAAGGPKGRPTSRPGGTWCSATYPTTGCCAGTRPPAGSACSGSPPGS